MRALRVLRALLHASVALALQYRIEFAVEGALALLWMAVTLVPLLVVFGNRGAVAGWTFPEMLIVLGWFVALKGVLEGTLSPSLMQVVEHVRKGTLDFVLIKPADAQLLVSFAKIEPWRVVDLVGAGFIFAYAFTWLPYIRNLIIHRRHAEAHLDCPGCGTSCLPQSRFCASCGTPVVAAEARAAR